MIILIEWQDSEPEIGFSSSRGNWTARINPPSIKSLWFSVLHFFQMYFCFCVFVRSNVTRPIDFIAISNANICFLLVLLQRGKKKEKGAMKFLSWPTTIELVVYIYREESSLKKSRKTRARVCSVGIVCTLFPRPATRRAFCGNSMGSAPGGESPKQGANECRGHGFLSRSPWPCLQRFVYHRRPGATSTK